MMDVAVTVDLHDGDDAEDIEVAATTLADAGVAATFFIPSAMFLTSAYVNVLKTLPGYGHEVGSHGHVHDWEEVAALVDGVGLDFLARSRSIFEDFYGQAPRAFRSPVWCTLGERTRDELQRLGYSIDSSATPQRLSILSSVPFRGTWLTSPRAPHFLRPGLREIPTSTLLLPAGSPTFGTLRRASVALIRILLAEARLFRDRVIVVQFDSYDLNARSARRHVVPPLTWRELVPLRAGGLGFRRRLRERNPARRAATTMAILALLRQHRFLTLSGVDETLEK